jgi:hypothetical protein
VLVIVTPQAVIAWHQGFRLFWTWKVRHAQTGRPPVSQDVRDLIRTMCRANPLCGAPRIPGELLKLGIDIGQTSVAKYMVRHRKPPSPTWRTFLDNPIRQLVSVDFFTVPTFQVLYCSVRVPVLAHERGAFYTSTSRRIRRRNGRPSNFEMRSPGTPHLATCCQTALQSLAMTSPNRCETWASSRCFALRARRGRRLTSSA